MGLEGDIILSRWDGLEAATNLLYQSALVPDASIAQALAEERLHFSDTNTPFVAFLLRIDEPDLLWLYGDSRTVACKSIS